MSNFTSPRSYAQVVSTSSSTKSSSNSPDSSLSSPTLSSTSLSVPNSSNSLLNSTITNSLNSFNSLSHSSPNSSIPSYSNTPSSSTIVSPLNKRIEKPFIQEISLPNKRTVESHHSENTLIKRTVNLIIRKTLPISEPLNPTDRTLLKEGNLLCKDEILNPLVLRKKISDSIPQIPSTNLRRSSIISMQSQPISIPQPSSNKRIVESLTSKPLADDVDPLLTGIDLLKECYQFSNEEINQL